MQLVRWTAVGLGVLRGVARDPPIMVGESVHIMATAACSLEACRPVARCVGVREVHMYESVHLMLNAAWGASAWFGA